ncbi:hypothetical protein [uncultured Flavobacterium sp.]|uniref:hypothetical protein n=1 Tax=uncultured Flavobacterium sp. TaxID=165435 RepID=UPI0025DAC751|nr:hypothetical protein [uncultured Flavobacterium sp.]
MKKIIYLVLLANSFYCNAQLDKTIHEMTKPSPEVASLGKYGELPINHYTGTANIDVPLHEIDFDGLKIPINLNYSTGGIKPNEEASWVGLGWGLSVEPIITRSIRGIGDIDQIAMQVGYPYTTTALPEHSYDFSYSSPLWEMIGVHEDRDGSVDTWDTEPDIFSVSLFGESAKFILTQKSLNGGIIGVKLLNEDSRLKVEYMESGKNFTVTNDRGFSFYFNKKEYSVVGVEGLADTYTVYQGFDNPQVTGWKIEKIVSPKGNTLFYEYHPTASIKDQPVASEKKLTSIICPNTQAILSPHFNAYANRDITPSRSMNFHASLYLKAIYCDQYRIEFTGSERSDIMDGYDNSYPMQSIFGFYDGHALKLDKITIKDFKGQSVKTINLNYTYFNDANTYQYFRKQYLRLKLNSVYVNNEFYRSFDYINPNLMPDKRTTSIDYWGYYNGKKNLHRYPSYKANVGCYLPGTQVLTRIFGANLLPDFNFGKNGLLYKVTYPTKGHTEIAYEPHSILLNAGTKNINVPFEDFEVFEATSYDEASPSDSGIFTLNGQEVDHMFVEGDTPNSAKSLFGHVVIEIGCGSGFSNTNLPSSYRKCDVLPSDGVKIAFQLINADSGEIVKMARFSMDTNCFVCPPISIPNGIFERNILLSELPAGRYFLRARALKHISNLMDEEDGIYPGNPDYMKQYYFPVRVKATIPKSALYANYNKEIGGARIQKITNFDSDASLISRKEYKYVDDFNVAAPKNSSGILINELEYGNDITYGNILIGPDESCTDSGGGRSRALTVYSENRRLHLAPAQNHVGYKRVEEINTSSSATSGIGKTVYYFSLDRNESVMYYNNPAFMIYRPLNPFFDETNLALAPKTTYEESNSDLLKTEYFDEMGNIKWKEENTYFYHHFYPPRKISTGMHIKFRTTFAFNCVGSFEIHGTIENMQIYEIKNEVTPLQKKTITEFLSGGNIAKSTEYSYNGRYLPNSIETATSEGTSSIIKNYYPGDAETAGFANSSILVSKNIIGSPLRSEKFSDTGLLEQVDKEYSLFNANTLLAESKMKALKGGGLMEDLFEYQQYDFRGNVTQYKKTSGIPVSIIWGYKSGLPVAKLENIAYADIPAQLITAIQQVIDAPNSTETQVLVALQALRSSTDANMKKTMITTYTYRPLIGMSTLTDTKGYKTTYEYDTFGRLEFVKDHQGNILAHNQYHYKL